LHIQVDGGTENLFVVIVIGQPGKHMPKAEINGTKLNFETHGNGEPLVLIAGLGGDLHSWKSMVTGLAKNHRVIILDNRGSGQSIAPENEFTVMDMADDVAGLLDYLDISKSHILGSSMGGNIAQEFALRHPDRIATLVLLSSYARRPDRSCVAIDAMIRAVKEGSSLETLQTMMQCWCLPEHIFEGKTMSHMPRQKVLSEPEKAFFEGFVRQKVALDGFDSRVRLKDIKVPTLVMHGTADIMVAAHHGEEMAKEIPGAKFIMVEGVGHVFTPNKCLDEVLSFLSDHPLDH
jgi:3-oxoadipate enol-lactonase